MPRAKNTDSDQKRRPTAIDLFCGCGGLTLGLKQAGFQVIGAVEIDPLAVQTYKANHRKVKVWDCDIRSLATKEVCGELGIEKGTLDLLAGCPPCQGFSSLRTLNGSVDIEDARNDLVFEFLRFVKALLPRTVMMENVPGLGKDNRFVSFCNAMRRMGYVGEYRILNAADYGVPQRRHRLIYLAGYGFPIPFAATVSQRRTVRDAIGALQKAGRSGDPLHDMPESRSPRISALIRKIPRDGGSRTDLPMEDQLDCHQRCNGFKDVYGRMSWDDVAPTMTSGCFNPSKGRFLHPSEHRGITMREAALLQSFPEKYRFPVGGKSDIAMMIGNALPPAFIRRHGMGIRTLLRPK